MYREFDFCNMGILLQHVTQFGQWDITCCHLTVFQYDIIGEGSQSKLVCQFAVEHQLVTYCRYVDMVTVESLPAVFR